MIEGWDDENETHQERELANERSNEHIEQYLGRYMHDPNAPGHAVMISGAWGIGKSHFIRDLVARYAARDTNGHYVHVSLSGLQTMRDFDIALSIALHPVLNSKVVKGASKLVTVITKHFNADPEVSLHALVNKFKAKLYVFDDLERCEAPIQTTLGYINRFVELEGKKVVIVAHEGEMYSKHTEYKGIKEKLVGQTFTFQPVIRLPLRQFIQCCGSDTAGTILNAQSDLILTRYAQSELNNLRVLRQTVWDFARLLDHLTEEQRSNHDLITSLVDTLMPLSFEFKAGRIGVNDIVEYNPYKELLVSNEKKKDTAWGRFHRRYPNNKLRDNVFNSSVLADILVHGFFDQDGLRQACDASRYSARLGEIASWRRLWQAFDENDAEVDQQIVDMEDRFRRREYVIPGELFHVLGLRVWLSRNNLIDSTPNEVIEQFKVYVDDLHSAGTIIEPNPNGDAIRTSGYGGLGIRDEDKPEYRAAVQYYISRRDEFLKSKRPDEAKLLLAELRSNPRSFISKICFTNDGTYQYRDIPILMHIDASDCAAALSELPPRDQQAVFSSIRERYEHGMLQGALSDERVWLLELRDRLSEITESKVGFAKFRLSSMIAWSIEPLLKEQPEEPVAECGENENTDLYD